MSNQMGSGQMGGGQIFSSGWRQEPQPLGRSASWNPTGRKFLKHYRYFKILVNKGTSKSKALFLIIISP